MSDVQFTSLQMRLLDTIQYEFPLAADPYAELATGLDAHADEVHAAVVRLRAGGIIRRIGGLFDAAALGYRSTLAAARVAPERLEEAAARASAWNEVTHNYERSGEFNLWFATIARNRKRLRRILDDVRSCPGVETVLDLPAIRRFKLRVDFRFGGSAVPGRAAQPKRDAEFAKGEEPSPSRAPELDETDRRIIARFSGDIEERTPFAVPARELGLDEEALLARLHGYRASGIMRRFGAILRHQRAGFRSNAMAVWDVGDADVEPFGRALAARAEVSHCYERARAPDWPFNLYAMIHGRTDAEVRSVADEASVLAPSRPRRLLFSLREFKKTSLNLLRT